MGQIYIEGRKLRIKVIEKLHFLNITYLKKLKYNSFD